MPKLSQFNGGMNIATAAHLLNVNEGPVYDNIDHIPGTLSPLREKVAAISGAKPWGHKFTQNQQWYWSDTAMDYVEFQEQLYIGNRNGPSTKIFKNTEYALGIIGPEDNPEITATSYDIPNIEDLIDATLSTFSFGTIGDIPKGLELKYRFVNETADTDYSNAEKEHTIKTSPTLDNNAVYIGFTEPKDLFAIRVYRWYIDEWRLVERLEIADPPEAFVIHDYIYDISASDPITAITLGGGGEITGKGIQYAYTFYSEVDGNESVPHLITPVVNVVSGVVEITGMEVSTQSKVTHKRIYRVGGELTTFTRVAEIDNLDTSYTDSAAADDISGELMDSASNYPPPEDGIHWLTESYAMLFAAVGDKLIFTPVGEPDYWPVDYYLDFPRYITGIAKTPIGLLVFSRYETWLVTGTGPLSLSQQLLTGSQGCIDHDTVVNIQGMAYWCSTDGICISEGGRVIVYTEPTLGKRDFSNAVNAKVWDGRYYLRDEYTDDFGTREITWILDIPRKTISTARWFIGTLNWADDILYGYRDGQLHELYNKDAPLNPMIWSSPKFIGRGYTSQKVYKNFYVACEGEIHFNIVIDGVTVRQVELNGYDNHQIKIPTLETRGLYVQFAITGTGTVYEISWDDGNANQ